MTCPACAQWCATTEEQLATRTANINARPEVQAHPCSQCGGTDWVSSREMIGDKPRVSWKERLLAGKSVGIFQFIAAAACLGLAILPDQRWISILDAFLAGTSLASGFFNILMDKQRRAFEGMHAAFKQMCDINNALIHVKAQLIINGEGPPIPPTRLH